MSIDIVNIKKVDISSLKKKANADVFCIHVKVNDIGLRAEELIQAISDTSWIDELGVVEKKSYSARAEKTIEKLVNDIFEKIEDEVTEEFGEYLVTESAKDVLESGCGHKKIPLAELWKEKVTGNPGFDFHTESKAKVINFGEGKYSSKKNPHTIAIGQIVDFISEKKDESELVDLQHLVSKDAIDNAVNNIKGFIAAFSLNGGDYDKIFDNALRSDVIDHVLDYAEIYLIGVEV